MELTYAAQLIATYWKGNGELPIDYATGNLTTQELETQNRFLNIAERYGRQRSLIRSGFGMWSGSGDGLVERSWIIPMATTKENVRAAAIDLAGTFTQTAVRVLFDDEKGADCWLEFDSADGPLDMLAEATALAGDTQFGATFFENGHRGTTLLLANMNGAVAQAAEPFARAFLRPRRRVATVERWCGCGTPLENEEDTHFDAEDVHR